jgi:hypothetical protein
MSIEDEKAEEIDFYEGYHRMIDASGRRFDNPDLMLFMLVELVGGCCYQVILYEKPVTLEELKPRLYESIRDIITNQEIS